MANLITLTCPSCGASIRVSADNRSYLCEYCGNQHVFNFAPGSAPRAAAVPPKRAFVPVPGSVQMQDDGQSLRITRRWFSLKYVPLAFFCVAWDAFLCFWYSMAFKIDAPWIMIVFPIGHLAVGVGLTYTTLAGFINHTVLEVTPKELSVWHDPLPWRGEITLPTRDVRQLYCTQKHKATGNGSGSTVQYQLVAITSDGRSHKLLSDLEDPDIPQYLEQQVEKWLHIEDRRIAGEISK